MTSTYRYLWNYEVITYSDGTTSETSKRVIGTYGDTGEKGAKGDTGAKGDKGDKGDTGEKGATGAPGAKGDKGDTGAKGDKGDTGATGPQGPAGAKGDKGDKGDQGETGPQGEQGDPGEDAMYVYITSDKSTATAREVASTVKLTAIVCKGEETDIDPQGYTYHYAWTQSIDNQAEKFAGKGRTYTITIDDNYCDEKAGVSVALVPTSYFWITNENNVRIEDGNGNPIEVA
jgi:hypothetical protein